MKAGSQEKPKLEYQKELCPKFGVGIRPFREEWAEAKRITETKKWGRPGPKS